MIAKAVKYALYSGFAASMAVAAPATFAAEEEAEEAETVVVTGSRLKRTDVEGANPVTVITREQIELSGEISAAELLRNTTFNTTGSFRPQSGSSAQGVSQIDLRGIGASRSLVLVDGRRLTMSPSTGSSQDLNSIPLGAIERIEILTDGASAIYGSDAIGGVVNVITRKDYNGAEISLQKGKPSIPTEGGEREAGNITFGASNDTTSILGGVSWNKRDIVYQRDFPWTPVAGSFYGNNFENTPEDLDNDGVADWGYVISGLPGSCGDENFIPSGPFCLFNYNSTNANEASSSNESLFLKASHMINDDWELYSSATIAKNDSFGRYAPGPDSNAFYGFEIAADSYNNPTNPDAWFYDTVNNPNAVPYDANAVGPNDGVNVYHRFAAAGNRDNDVRNENVDLLLGSTGYVGDVEVDFGLRRVRNSTVEIGNGYVSGLTAWGYINDFNPGYSPDGTVFDPDTYYYGYNLQVPSSNPDDVLAGSVVTTSRDSQFNFDEAFASAAFDIGELDGGTMQAFVGAEYRKETYQDNYDSQSEAGLVGGSAGNSAGGDRTAKALFFETVFPFTDDFEMNVAGRYDKYSDYGNDFAPKVSFRYQAADDMMFRLSYGEGFRAPSLDLVTMATSYSAEFVSDPATCVAIQDPDGPGCETQVNTYISANPDLESEQSTQYAFGWAYQPTDWANFSVDYYNIEIENLIAYFSVDTIVRREAAGDPYPATFNVIRDPNQCNQYGCRIIEANTGYGNEGSLETDGIDLNARFNFDFEGMGRLNQNFQVSWINDYTLSGGRNLVRDPGVPQWRAALQNVYNINDFTIAWNVNAIGGTYTTVVEVPGDDGVGRSGNIGVWTTHDLQVSYNTPWDGQISVGAQNVFEKYPTLVGFGGRDYNYNLYNGYGRVAYVRYSQTF